MLNQVFRPLKSILSPILVVVFAMYQQGCAVYNSETKTTISQKDVSFGKKLFLQDKEGRRYSFLLNELNAETLNAQILNQVSGPKSTPVANSSPQTKDVTNWPTSNTSQGQMPPEGAGGKTFGPSTRQTTQEPTYPQYRSSAANGEEVVIYLGKGITVNPGKSLIIPLSQMELVEVRDLSTGKTIFATVLAVLGYSILIFVVLLVIILATKDSCPFLYAWDGTGYDFKGELYSGSVYPFLERHDYLPIGEPVAVDGQYRLRLRNEIKEIQHTNAVDLVLVDHAPSTQVLLDKNGQLHEVTQWIQPNHSVAGREQSIDSLLLTADDKGYVSNTLEYQNRYDLDQIQLTFPKPAHAKTATLGIRAKNTFWLDYAYGQFLDLFGESLPAWNRHVNKDDPAEHLRWTHEQGLYLNVYVEENGQWVYRDHFNLAGPMAYKNDALGLDVSGLSGDSVKVKFEFGPQFWDIDQVGIAYESTPQAHTQTLPLLSAKDEMGTDRLAQLQADDSSYYDQPEIGNEAVLSFKATSVPEGMVRSAFVHSKGHYEILRDTRGKSLRLATLWDIKKPGGFGAFTRDLMQQHVDAGKRAVVAQK